MIFLFFSIDFCLNYLYNWYAVLNISLYNNNSVNILNGQKEVKILANIKSAKKRILVINKKTEVNKSRKSEIKTYIKKFEAALSEGNFEKAKECLSICEKKLYQAAAKNTIHKNAASRKVSRLAHRLNKIA